MTNEIKNKIINALKNKNNKSISKNVLASFIVKGLSIILVLFTTPAYMKYFNNDTALGGWFTVVSIINWVLMFDLGIGNGLRNKLPKAIEENDKNKQRELLSSAYISIFAIALVFLVILLIGNSFINWNNVLNIDKTVLSQDVLRKSMLIMIIGIVLRLVLNLNTSVFYVLQKSSINNIISFLSTLLLFLFVSFAKVDDINTNFIKLSIANAILSNLPLLIGTLYIFLFPFKRMWPKLKYFRKKEAKEILNIGLILLWLQIVFMIISSTHAFLITNFTSPDDVVEYNIYYKVYYGILSIFYLSLSPIWSAVTKAQAQNDYNWIYKMYVFLLILVIPFTIANFLSIPILQKFFDIWLKENTILVNVNYVYAFIFFNFCFAIHNVNTSIFNGLSDFKIQTLWMSIAAVIAIPISYLLTQYLNSWIGVIIGCTISIIPYEIIQTVFGLKKLYILKNKKGK